MQSCISHIKALATTNMYELSHKKEFMLVTLKRALHLHNIITWNNIGNAQIPFKQSVNNMSLTLDCRPTMNKHVTIICQTCYFELRRLASIRRFVTITAITRLASAFGLPRIDNCNSLLFVSTHHVTPGFQRIQNYAVRVILRIPKSANITTHFKSLN